jgi:NAD(P)-dependent dehydrogenase (short-subunit alcohol dehydrogenase family)
MTLQGAGILITGGSLGIGRVIAKACVEAGAGVLICARDRGALDRAKWELEQTASTGQVIRARAADVSRPDDVTALVDFAVSELPNFSGLVNCAAITGPTGLLEEADVQQWISTIQVNLIGTMLMCRAVIPHFRKQVFGRIINFSGGGATSPRPRFSAYAVAKTAVVRLTETLAQELNDTNICVNAIAPGAVNTRMLDDVLNAGPESAGTTAYEEALKQRDRGGVPPEKAAGLCLKLLSRESDGLSGKLFSAVWDSWDALLTHRKTVMESDLYTLRRIVPKDRGLSWS